MSPPLGAVLQSMMWAREEMARQIKEHREGLHEQPEEE
jgi:hypothetical protein